MIRVGPSDDELLRKQEVPRPMQQIGGQASKGTRWMPWRQEAMKDVASCDKFRGAASRR